MWPGSPSCSRKLLKGLVVSLPTSVSPRHCAPWQPDSHDPQLEQSPSRRGYAAVPGNSHSTSTESQLPEPGTALLPHHAQRGALHRIWASGTLLPTCQARSPSYTNSRTLQLFEITQQCLAPCFPCKDSHSCSRYKLLFPEGLWSDRLRHFQMEMIGGEKSRCLPHSLWCKSLPHGCTLLPHPFCSLQAMGRVGRGQGTESLICRCYYSQCTWWHCMPPACCAHLCPAKSWLAGGLNMHMM